jgi:hypothetical protein
MGDVRLEDRDWNSVLGGVEGLGKEVTQKQMQALMAVPAKAALDLGIGLSNLAKRVEQFDRSTSRLTVVLIWLTVMLVIAACLQAVGVLLSS